MAVAVAVVAVVPAIRVRETPPRGGVLHVLVLCGKRYGACPADTRCEGPDSERNERVKFAGSGFTRSGDGGRGEHELVPNLTTCTHRRGLESCATSWRCS